MQCVALGLLCPSPLSLNYHFRVAFLAFLKQTPLHLAARYDHTNAAVALISMKEELDKVYGFSRGDKDR